MTQIANHIDDLHYENFHVPILRHQQRVIRSSGGNESRSPGHVYSECDYLDAQTQHTYTTPQWLLREPLTTQETQRLQAVNRAVLCALTGTTVTLKQLRCALTPLQLTQFEQSLTETHDPSEYHYGTGMPDELRRYNKLLNKADFAWSRFEALPTAPRHGSRRTAGAAARMESSAVSLYEDALEYLIDVFSSAKHDSRDPTKFIELTMWMDRHVDYDAGTSRQIDTDPYAIPRVRGSKSGYADDSGLPKLSKRIKRQYCALLSLLVAGCELAFVLPEQQDNPMTQQAQQQQRDKLRMLLRKIK